MWSTSVRCPDPPPFAFVTTAHSITLEWQADRARIHTYYTGDVPEIELAEGFRETGELLEAVLDGTWRRWRRC